MKKYLLFIFVIALLQSCQYLKDKFALKKDTKSTRGLAQDSSADQGHYHSQKSIFTFNTLMKYPLQDSHENFLLHIRAFVERQFDSLYIGQSLMHDFDKELDHLLRVKGTKPELSNEDYQKINLLYFQLRIAWVVYERNLHELLDLYLLTLETRLMTDINGDTDKRTKTTLILSQIPGWLDNYWKEKYKVGVIAIAQEIDQVNKKFIANTPAAARYTTKVERFVNISKADLQKAHLESKDAKVTKNFEKLSRFIEKTAKKQFEEEFDEHTSDPNKLMQPYFDEQKRDTDAALDKLFPSPGVNGHMSGKLVPANSWALTFDDGPHPQYSELMFDALKAHKAPATFFWLSKNMKAYPQIVDKAKANGYYRASHSMTHANLPKLNAEQLEFEITAAAELFQKIVGERPTLFRCPYGACGPMDSPIRKVIAKNNMLHVHWTVDPLDWQDKNPQSIFDRTKKQIELRGKGIVLFHDVHPQSVEAVKLMLNFMKSKKYRIISLPQMITETREEKFDSP